MENGDSERPLKRQSVRERERVGDRVSIYKVAGSPYWYISYSDARVPIRKSLHTESKKRAIKLAKKKDAELVLGISAGRDRHDIGIKEAITEYIESLRLKGLKESTLYGYRGDLSQFAAFAKSEGVVRLAHVDARLLEAFQTRLQNKGMRGIMTQTGRGRKYNRNLPKTLRNKLKNVKQLLKWAVRRKLLRDDPASGFQLPPKPKTKAYCWTPAQFQLVRAQAELGWLEKIDFIAMTGLRSNEWCWLLKTDVVLGQEPHVEVRSKTCPQTGRYWEPKQGKDRTVPLCPEAAEIARRAAAESPGPWLFWSPLARGPQIGHHKPASVWRAVRRARTAAGITRGTTHTLRHIFCSFMANNNVPPFQVMMILGHGSLDIVLTYYHLDRKQLLHTLDGLPFAKLQGKEAT